MGATNSSHQSMATVFYSWQSDRDTTTNRNLVERALGDAIKALTTEASIEEAERSADSLQLDKDTKGVPGSPPITQTIFAKIDRATAFVADLTFVGQRTDGRQPHHRRHEHDQRRGHRACPSTWLNCGTRLRLAVQRMRARRSGRSKDRCSQMP